MSAKSRAKMSAALPARHARIPVPTRLAAAARKALGVWGRPDVRRDFPPGTAGWLCHLLDRCERQRREIVRKPANDFLFVSSASARRNMPVGNIFFWEIVQRASLRVLGAACNPNTLRKTVGVMFADKAGAGILRWMGWDDQQAFAYTWAGRETVHPRSPDGDNDTLPEQGADPVSFPSPRGAV